MPSVLEALKERGFSQQCTDEAGVDKLLSSGPVVFYCGFDPTAESLHCGSLMPIMTMAHLQQAGHQRVLVSAQRQAPGEPVAYAPPAEAELPQAAL